MRQVIAALAVIALLFTAASPAVAAPPTGSMGAMRYEWTPEGDVRFAFGVGTATNGQYFTLHVSDGRTVRLWAAGDPATGYLLTWDGAEYSFITADYKPTCYTGPLSYYVTIDNVDGTGPATNSVTVEPQGCSPSGGGGDPPPGSGGGTTTAPTVAPQLSVVSVSCTGGYPLVTLSWSQSDNNASYRLYRDGVMIGTPSATSVTWYDSGTLTAGTSYQYYLVPTNSAGDGPLSNTAVAAIPVDVCGGTSSGGGGGGGETIPPAPDLAGITADCTTVTFSWSAVSGATGYNVYRGSSLLTTTTATSYSGSIDRTQDNTYRVTAVNGAGESTWNDSYYVQADPNCSAPPSGGGGGGGPLNLRYDTTQCPTITFTWDTVPGAAYYHYFKADPFESWGTTTETTFTYTPPLGTTDYGLTFGVEAMDSSGNKLGQEDIVSALCQSPQPPPEPCQSPAAPQVSGTFDAGNVTLTWSPVTGAVSYRVYMDGQLVQEIADTTWSGTYPLNGAGHQWSVTAVASCGAESGAGTAGTVSLVCQGTSPPATPTLTRTDMDAGEVILAWSAVAGAKAYNIYRRLSAGTSWDLVGQVNTTYYNGFYPKDGRVYEYTVTAVSDCWESQNTPPVQGSCLCSLKDYLVSGAPIPPPPDLPPITTPTPPAPPVTPGQRPGKTVPPVPTLPVPPDVPPPPALPPVEDPNLCPWGMCAQGPGEGDQPTQPGAPGLPDDRLMPATPVTPAGPLTPATLGTPSAPLTPATPGTPSGPLTPADPLTPSAPLTPIAPMAPLSPAAPLEPDPPLMPSG